MTIDAAITRLIGNESAVGDIRTMEAAIEMGIQNITGENIPARKW